MYIYIPYWLFPIGYSLLPIACPIDSRSIWSGRPAGPLSKTRKHFFKTCPLSKTRKHFI